MAPPRFSGIAAVVLAVCLTALALSHRNLMRKTEQFRVQLAVAQQRPNAASALLLPPEQNIIWVVVEDSDTKTDAVAHVLKESGVSYAHLNVKEHRKPNDFKANTQRNLGIHFIQTMNPRPHLGSQAYFADDDNAYAVDLFDEIAKVKNVGVWPVAFSGARRVEYPQVEGNRVVGFFSYSTSSRAKFPLDMAAFAVSIRYFFLDPPVLFEPLAPTSTGEVRFLTATGIKWGELEPLADRCSRVLVWHVKTTARVEDKYDAATSQFTYV